MRLMPGDGDRGAEFHNPLMSLKTLTRKDRK